MQYLVEMKLAAAARPTTEQEGAGFIEHYIVPTLEMCKKMQEERKILAGGPMSGTIGIAVIVESGSAAELDERVASLPVWPLMETTVTPLTTFDGRIATVLPKLERLRSRTQTDARSPRRS